MACRRSHNDMVRRGLTGAQAKAIRSARSEATTSGSTCPCGRPTTWDAGHGHYFHTDDFTVECEVRPADDWSTIGQPVNALGLVFSEAQQGLIDPFLTSSEGL